MQTILSIIATHSHILLTTAEKDTSNIDIITHHRDLQGFTVSTGKRYWCVMWKSILAELPENQCEPFGFASWFTAFDAVDQAGSTAPNAASLCSCASGSLVHKFKYSKKIVSNTGINKIIIIIQYGTWKCRIAKIILCGFTFM